MKSKIAGLRKQIAGREEERKEMLAKLQALEVQLQFWQAQTKAKTKTLADTSKLADAIGKKCPEGSSRKINNRKLSWKKLTKNIKKLKEELNQAAGKKRNRLGNNFKQHPDLAKTENSAFLHLLSRGLWLASPLSYRGLTAADKIISFSWDAEIWQSSGEDWKQVQLNVATLQPIINVAPPELPEWIIKPEWLYKASRSKKYCCRAFNGERSL